VTRRVLPALVAVAALAAIAIVLFTGDRDGGTDRFETGVVVGVDAEGLTEVLAFTLRTSDGRTIEFLVGRLENEAQFPAAHLGEHLVNGVPIRVRFRLEGEDRVARGLEDAP
jgi:hypothetical protein